MQTRKRILLIDDDPTVREYSAFILERRGFEVVQAADGVEGLARMNEDGFVLILCDMSMPRMDGKAFYEAVRGVMGKTKFAFYTGGPHNLEAIPVFEWMARERVPWISKMSSPDELSAFVSRLVYGP